MKHRLKFTARKKPHDIGKEIADAGALLHETHEFKGVASAAARAIREERRGAICLTKGEAKAALDAISQMTFGNARDYSEWKSQTHGTRSQWEALLRAEAKISILIGYPEPVSDGPPSKCTGACGKAGAWDPETGICDFCGEDGNA